MHCTIEQFEDVLKKFKIFAESVDIELSTEAESLRFELLAVSSELLAVVREEIVASGDSIIK